jgi:hypothetical protein
MTKYQKYVSEMMEKHEALFKEFRHVHDNFIKDPDTAKSEFNRIGSEVLVVIREYENRLCGHSERGMYGKFSSNLAEKFQNEVRKIFPKIDFVGIK